MIKKPCFFTVVARNYLAQAYVLGDSVLKYHPEAIFYIFLMDDINYEYKEEILNKDFFVIYPDQIEITNYKNFVFKYSIVEACTAVKPYVMKYLLNQGAEKVIYLDPDILCFRRLDEVLQDLNMFSIIITPHSLSPFNFNDFLKDNIFLTFGVYNLGFIAIAASSVAERFLDWWANHLSNECLMDIRRSIYVDQKWADLIPAYFDRVRILRSLGHNIAYWNIHERVLGEEDDRLFVRQNNEPVTFMHFSGLNIKSLDSISRSLVFMPEEFIGNGPRETLGMRPDLVAPFKLYAKLLFQSHYERYVQIPYAFSNYSNGEIISQEERSLYRESPQWSNQSSDPFQVGDGSFQEFCRKTGIRAGNSRSSVEDAFVKQKGLVSFFKGIVYFIILTMNRIFGADLCIKVLNFARTQSVELKKQAHKEK